MVANLLIIVPTLNSFNLLPPLIESLQKQNWPHWRLIFIDGPSSPEHRLWLKRCCIQEPRCSWLVQNPLYGLGIFGAMNHGFAMAAPNDWLLFWGSDDIAATDSVFSNAMAAIERSYPFLDLLVCQGRYFNTVPNELHRTTRFLPCGIYRSASYRRALWLGSSPPHQATFFGPRARAKLPQFSEGFTLSADLDYFLQLSRNSDLHVRCLDLDLVHMSDGGVSGQRTKRRLLEVFRAYRRAFGPLWFCPFILRYIRRLFSIQPTFR